MKKSKFAMSVVLGLVLLVMAMWAVWMQPQPEVAMAQTWPTPQPFAFGGGEWVMVPYINAASVITPANVWYTDTTEFQTAAYVLGDFHTVFDEHSANVVTCTLDFSNDSVTWCTTALTLANMSADGDYCQTLPLFGRYSRVRCLAGENELYTITVRAKLYN